MESGRLLGPRRVPLLEAYRDSMNWDSMRDLHPKNAGPMVFIGIGLALLLLFNLGAAIWLAVDRSPERERCAAIGPNADLSDCGLTTVRLAGVDLSGANLTNASMPGRKMLDANVTNTRVEGAVWNDTTCPDGMTNEGNRPC